MIVVDDSLVRRARRAGADASRRSSTSSSSATADAGSLPERDLRYEELLRRAERGLRLAGARRPPGGGPLLHERHHRATRRASSTPTARRPARARRSAWPTRWRLRADDRVLPVVPMFHANAWGSPTRSALTGADLVMPGPFLQARAARDAHRAETRDRLGGACRRSGWTCCATPTSTSPTCRAMRHRDLRRLGRAARR